VHELLGSWSHELCGLRIWQLPLWFGMCLDVSRRLLSQRIRLLCMHRPLCQLLWHNDQLPLLHLWHVPPRLCLLLDLPRRLHCVWVALRILSHELQCLLVHGHMHHMLIGLLPLQRQLLHDLPQRHLLGHVDHVRRLQLQLFDLLGIAIHLHSLWLVDQLPLQWRLLLGLPCWILRIVDVGLLRLHLSLRQLHVGLLHRLHRLCRLPAAALRLDVLRHLSLRHL